MKTKAFAALAAVGIAASIASLAISPAGAEPIGRSLSAGSSLFAVNCYGAANNLQLFSLDTTTAAATPVGTGANAEAGNCAGQSAWDAVNNSGYYTTFSVPSKLYKVDPATGDSTFVGNVTGGDTEVDAIAIGKDGAGYALRGGILFSLNLDTAALTRIGETGDTQIFGFAVDPATGNFYTINTGGEISTIDVSTGGLTALGQADLDGENETYSLQVDSNGTFWIENDDELADLWSVDPANIADSAILSGTLNTGGDVFYSESLLLIPAVAITSAAPAASIVAGTPVSFTVTATGAGPITLSITAGALPTGLVLDPATGVISGTPTAAGTFTFTVTASNRAGSTSATYTQTITPYLPVVSG